MGEHIIRELCIKNIVGTQFMYNKLTFLQSSSWAIAMAIIRVHQRPDLTQAELNM